MNFTTNELDPHTQPILYPIPFTRVCIHAVFPGWVNWLIKIECRIKDRVSLPVAVGQVCKDGWISYTYLTVPLVFHIKYPCPFMDRPILNRWVNGNMERRKRVLLILLSAYQAHNICRWVLRRQQKHNETESNWIPLVCPCPSPSVSCYYKYTGDSADDMFSPRDTNRKTDVRPSSTKLNMKRMCRPVVPPLPKQHIEHFFPQSNLLTVDRCRPFSDIRR